MIFRISRKLGDKDYENENPLDLVRPDDCFGFLSISHRKASLDPLINTNTARADGDEGGGDHIC